LASREGRSSRGPLIAIVVAVLVIGGAIGVLVSRSNNKKSTSTTLPTGSASPIPLPTLQSKMGMATGVQLWNDDPAEMDKEIPAIAATGAKWLRTSLLWKDVEPSSANQDDFSRSDRIVADSQKAGISVIFILSGAPDWAGAQESGEFSTDPRLYADFAAKLATRYRGKVRVYELGNEPNGTNYVPSPDPATYTKILQAAYPAIKAADPDAFVLTAGLAGGRNRKGNIAGDTFLSELYQDGAKGFFDAISFHPYTYPQLPTEEATRGGRSWSMMLRVRQLMVDNGDAGKQIWVTEFGAPTQGPNSVSEDEQASLLKDGFDLWKTYSWGGVFCWFDYQDKGGTDTSTHKGFFGLVDNSGSHKPSYDAYVEVARGD
jgi:polysaccharide biosynthesis protein PslG